MYEDVNKEKYISTFKICIFVINIKIWSKMAKSGHKIFDVPKIHTLFNIISTYVSMLLMLRNGQKWPQNGHKMAKNGQFYEYVCQYMYVLFDKHINIK